MNNREFSDSFTTLLNSYQYKSGFGDSTSIDIVLDEYEKSVFLTNAQEDIVREYYSGKGITESFEETEEARRALAELVIHKEITVSKASASSDKLTDKSYIATLPTDKKVWYIIYEGAILNLKGSDACEAALEGIGQGVTVVPTRYDELHSLLNNPFRGPIGNRVLRLDKSENQVELISINHPVAKYVIRYITQPSPIILINLPDGLNIRNINTATECQLPTQLHQAILERAVAYAVRSKLTARAQS